MSTKKIQKETEENKKVSEFCQYLEKKMGLRPSQIAQLLGVTRGTYSQWRNLHNKLPIDIFLYTLDKLSLDEKRAVRLVMRDYKHLINNVGARYQKPKPKAWTWKT